MNKSVRPIAVVMLLTALCAGCHRELGSPEKKPGQITDNYDQAVRSGVSEVSYSKEFNQLFTNAINGISYYSGESGQPRWYSKAGLYGRYVIRMYAPIKLDAPRTRIISMDAPAFDIYEIRKIQPAPSGAVG